MRFETETVDNTLIVSPPEIDLDASNADEFKRDIVSTIGGYTKVVMDMKNVGFMDSAGLGAMLSAFKKIRAEGGQFRIYGLNKEVKTLFELVRMHRLFQVLENRETALASLG